MYPDQSAALEIHQKARAELSNAPLTWDSKLATDAQQYANQLAAANSGLQHSTQLRQQKQGENLASCAGPWPNPYTESSKLWYAEKKDWQGGVFQAQNTQAVRHYTQMIWGTTTHVGMAVTVSSSGTTYVVARYSPPGNYIGQSPAQASKSGVARKPKQGRQQRPGQRDSLTSPAQASNSGGARRSMQGRQQWPGQRDSPTSPAQASNTAGARKPRRSNRSGNYPPFPTPGLGSMQLPSPYLPFSPGFSGRIPPYHAFPSPSPHTGVLGPHEYNRWLNDPLLKYSPYNPLGPIVNPDYREPEPKGCCVIL